MTVSKRRDVPLEEALAAAGSGWYTRRLWLAAGLANFSAFVNAQAMSVVVTAASCDLAIDSYQKGLLSSISYVGTIFSSHLGGVLADVFGRHLVIQVCLCLSAAGTLLGSMAPGLVTLTLAFFVNGFLVSGIFTPVYVYACEFCPAEARTTALIVVASIGSLANAFLPCVAWLVLPLELEIGGWLELASWRLLLAILSLPMLVAAGALSFFPETPKFLLNQGRHEETMQILRTIHSSNSKDEFPVESVRLDGIDEESNRGARVPGPSCLEHASNIYRQTLALFQRRYLRYTLLSCSLILINGAVYNAWILWMPVETQELFEAWRSSGVYNKTLCDVMSQRNEAMGGASCDVNYEAFYPGILIGLLEFVVFYLVNYIQLLVGPKPVSVVFSAIAAAACGVLLISDNFYLTVGCIVTVIVLLFTIFSVGLSVVVSYFPTSLRSNATSIMMLGHRTATVLFTQGLGAAFQHHCQLAYSLFTLLLAVLVVLYIVMPIRR